MFKILIQIFARETISLQNYFIKVMGGSKISMKLIVKLCAGKTIFLPLVG